jgi:FAD/FMN-containing dehydrogenase/Fe-S oxidoreductase
LVPSHTNNLAALPVITEQPDARLDTEALYRTLQDSLSTHNVRSDRVTRALYATDASVYQIVPLMVAFPATAADIAAVVRTCRRFGVPITARGGGTSQAGQSIGSGVIIDCSQYFNRVLEINHMERWARVEPGCVLDELNRALKPARLLFAPDISTSNRATIGGMIANNSSGARSILYGKTIDHVLELTAVLSDGSVIHAGPLSKLDLKSKCERDDLEGACYRTTRQLSAEHAGEIDLRFPKILRRVGGYNLCDFVQRNGGDGATHDFNLTRLLVGSEGTLAVTVEAKLKLVELPRARATLVVEFRDLLEALAATPAILKHQPAAVEVIDQYVLNSTKLNPEASRLRSFLQGDPAAILLIELYGDHVDDLKTRLTALEQDLRHCGLGYHHLAVTDTLAQARVWKLRTLALGLSMAEKGDAKAISFVEDSAVASEHLRDYIAELLELIARHGTQAGVYAHASVGCLHVRPVINLKTAEGVHKFEAIATEVADLVLKYGGALSGEHGDGLVRSPFQEKMYGPVLYQAFRDLKHTFDPHNIFNPGKIVDAPPITTNLRYGPAYQTPRVPTTFDFTADGGLLRAAELCAGVGVCRNKGEGTMCPSFQATRQEKDSTRGRANLLRMAITGQLGFEGFTDPNLHDVLDLCLECKGCKSECPTNIDMARIKAEFLHQYYRRHGLPWRNRLFGHIAGMARLGSAFAPASNWLAHSALVRSLLQRLLQIDRRRIPPAFAHRTLQQQFQSLQDSHQLERADHGILLFPDTFTNFFEPEVGAAAIALFRRARIEPTFGPPGLLCCGRPLISNGLLDEAVAHARHNVKLLFDWAQRGGVITACEPSCILTIRDDYPALVQGDLRLQGETVAHACRTFEECLGSVLDRNLTDGLSWNAAPPVRVFVQPHCHQRSLVGGEPMFNLLRRVSNAEVEDVNAGCCGMAGSFGYELEHYEISRLVAEQRLLPALHEASADAIVVAPGFSCRLQIEHFAARRAVHPAVFLQACSV